MSKIYIITQHTIDGKTVYPFSTTKKSSAKYTTLSYDGPSADIGSPINAKTHNQYYDYFDLPDNAKTFGFLYLQIKDEYELSYDYYPGSNASNNQWKGNARVYKITKGYDTPSKDRDLIEDNAVGYIKVCDYSIEEKDYGYFKVEANTHYIIDYYFEYANTTPDPDPSLEKKFVYVSTYDWPYADKIQSISLSSTEKTIVLKPDPDADWQWVPDQDYYMRVDTSPEWTVTIGLEDGYTVGTTQTGSLFDIYSEDNNTKPYRSYGTKVFYFDFGDNIAWRLDFNIVKESTPSTGIKSGDLYVMVNGVKKRLIVKDSKGNIVGHLVAK